jgi:hypothetical protein
MDNVRKTDEQDFHIMVSVLHAMRYKMLPERDNVRAKDISGFSIPSTTFTRGTGSDPADREDSANR